MISTFSNAVFMGSLKLVLYPTRNRRLLVFLLPKSAKGIKKALCCVARLSDLSLQAKLNLLPIGTFSFTPASLVSQRLCH